MPRPVLPVPAHCSLIFSSSSGLEKRTLERPAAAPARTSPASQLYSYLSLSSPSTKPPLLQESRLTGGGSPIGCVLVEWKVPVECEVGAAINFH